MLSYCLHTKYSVEKEITGRTTKTNATVRHDNSVFSIYTKNGPKPTIIDVYPYNVFCVVDSLHWKKLK